MSIEFPLTRFRTKFGTVYRPVVSVVLTGGQYRRTFKFILDSGAEFTMVPQRIGKFAGLDLEEFTSLTVTGIEGGRIAGKLAPLELRIGKSSGVTVRCFFAERDDAPFLLGRADFFDRFNIFFDARRKKMVFTRI